MHILMIDVIISTSRPLYGGGSGVCVYFIYVYIFCDLLLSFGRLGDSLWFPWDHFGPPLASLGMPVGAPWAPRGLSLGSLWPPFCCLGVLLSIFWAPWAPKGSSGDFGSKMIPNGRPFPEIC